MRPVTRLHRHLARAEPIAALSALAIPTGLAVGAVIVAFRLLTERLPVWFGWLPAVDRYEALPLAWRIGLPIAGGIAIGIALQVLPAAVRATGPTHVLATLARAVACPGATRWSSSWAARPRSSPAIRSVAKGR